jgi:predicted TIM-barrel fold metal-dependent hydrolase
MRITDCHIHVEGEADPADVLRGMDAAGVDRIVVLSSQERVSLSETRRKVLSCKRLMDAAPDRITGLAFVDPTITGMAGLVAEAVTELGYTGIKIIPDHWFAYEERLEPFWERMNTLATPILFHTGILYANDDGSRFCKPLWLEKLLHYPRIKFAMAHISWPWCEEHLAVMGRMRDAANQGGFEWQSYTDITPGTPPHIHKQALENAISFSGADRIMWGSDTFLPGDMENTSFRVKHDMALLNEIGVSDTDIQRIMSGTADEVFPSRR